MPFQIVRNDITRMEVDAVVNAANEELRMGGGVCGAIFRAAGAQELQRECQSIGHCPTGQAVITSGYALPANYIIHTVGPIWWGGRQGEAALLESSYTNSLRLAVEKGCRSVAFPLISSGIFGYPKEEALRVAADAIGAFLRDHDLAVYLVVFDKQSFSIGEERFQRIQSYIDDRYVEQEAVKRPRRALSVGPRQLGESPLSAAPQAMEECAAPVRKLEDLAGRLEEGFSPMLLRLIHEKGMGDVEVYKRANVDRKLFSKIRNNPAYSPSKSTAIAFAVALKLNLDQTRDLLKAAGYALSRSSISDIVIEYFIENGDYDIFAINEALFAFDQTLLGAV